MREKVCERISKVEEGRFHRDLVEPWGCLTRPHASRHRSLQVALGASHRVNELGGKKEAMDKNKWRTERICVASGVKRSSDGHVEEQ
jgi:hypothetical protein